MQLAAKAIDDGVKRAQATGKKIKSARNWRQRDRPEGQLYQNGWIFLWAIFGEFQIHEPNFRVYGRKKTMTHTPCKMNMEGIKKR